MSAIIGSEKDSSRGVAGKGVSGSEYEPSVRLVSGVVAIETSEMSCSVVGRDVEIVITLHSSAAGEKQGVPSHGWTTISGIV